MYSVIIYSLHDVLLHGIYLQLKKLRDWIRMEEGTRARCGQH